MSTWIQKNIDMNDIIFPVIIGVVAIIVGYGIAKILEKNCKKIL